MIVISLLPLREQKWDGGQEPALVIKGHLSSLRELEPTAHASSHRVFKKRSGWEYNPALSLPQVLVPQLCSALPQDIWLNHSTRQTGFASTENCSGKI
jgi:hypothetical protein